MAATTDPTLAAEHAQPAAANGAARRPRPDGIAGLRTVSFVALLVLWQLASAYADDAVLPSPLAVAASIVHHLVHEQMLFHLGATLARVAASFVIAMAVGSAVGIAMGRYRTADRLLDPVMIVGLNIPALVVTVLCYLWFGLVEVAAVAAVAINKIPMVVVLVREGARAVEPERLAVARVYRVSRARTFLKVYLPQLYPSLMASARTGLALIWKIVLVVELLGRSSGVGFQLAVLFQFFDVAGILAYTAVFVGIMLAIEGLLLRPVERRMTGWRR